MKKLCLVFILLAGCKQCPPPSPPSVVLDASGQSTLAVENATDKNSVVYVAFGADSVVLPSAWTCTQTGPLNCNFPLKARATLALPTSGYLNATFAFGSEVGCGSTKAELNLNNPSWYDTTDVSLVDGYSNEVVIEVADANGKHVLGPPNGSHGNEKVFGLFPLGCDVCVARANPPCGMKPGRDGCKAGPDPYHPDVKCQYQGPTMSGGSTVLVKLLAGVPAKM